MIPPVIVTAESRQQPGSDRAKIVMCIRQPT